MAMIGKLLSFLRLNRNGIDTGHARIDVGGNPGTTAMHLSAPGDDTHPIVGDYMVSVRLAQLGRRATVGYIDPVNAPIAEAGDRRVYARDASGTTVAQVWLKNTGEILISNDSGSITLALDGAVAGANSSGGFELQSDGTFVVNGVEIDPTGLITTPTGIVTPSALVNGVEVATHVHPQGNDSGGNVEQPTGIMV